MLTRADIDDLKRAFVPADEPADGPPDVPPQDEYPESADGEPIIEIDPVTVGGAAPVLVLICPPDWRGVPIPPMRWLATNRIPAADVTILSGDGGGGKTTTALQLAVSVAADLGDWLGTTCETGPVIFFSAEEPENEMRRRLERVARKRGLEAADIENLHFHFAEPDKCTLGTGRPNFPIASTPLFESLREAAKVIRPRLIVVDSNAATLGGNYLDRVHARTFVSLFRQLAREVDCAVLLLDHPSLSGMTNGTGRAGNMDWQNAVRALLYLRTTENEQGATAGRELEVMKSNYGPRGEKQKLRWEDGCYVLEGTTAAPAQAAAYSAADQVYLDCLDAATAQGRHVCYGTGRNYAPKAFAEMPQAKGMTRRAFEQAQERLFAGGMIENVAYGPPSKGTKRVARKG
jgi:RecA-family ATPase